MSNLLERKSVVRVKEFLNKYDNNINLIALDESARTAKDAGNALNTKVHSIVKSLLFKDTDNKFYLCLVSGDKYISLDKIEKIIKKKLLRQMQMKLKNKQVIQLVAYPLYAITSLLKKFSLMKICHILKKYMQLLDIRLLYFQCHMKSFVILQMEKC